MLTLTTRGGGQSVSLEKVGRAEVAHRQASRSSSMPAFRRESVVHQCREPGQDARPVTKSCARVCAARHDHEREETRFQHGGWVRHDEPPCRARNRLILTEGFLLRRLAGRDLDEIAVGLREIVDEQYLVIASNNEYIGERLTALGVPIVLPGRTRCSSTARRFLPHIPPLQYRAGLAVALYERVASGRANRHRDVGSGRRYRGRRGRRWCAWRCHARV